MTTFRVFRILAQVAGLMLAVAAFSVPADATDYEVGPHAGMLPYLSDVPWESLEPGDRVEIHWRLEAYREKFVLCRRGTAEAPIVVTGVPGPAGQRPVIDGQNAVTRTELNFWNESRGVIKIGGANVPSDTLPAHIVIENLEIRSGRPPYAFTDFSGGVGFFAANAASIYVEKAEHLVIRNNVLRDSGNGLFIGAFDGETRDILIENNWIYDNGIEGSIYQHNTYTAAIGIVYQFNRLGRLREGCGGNNLKDRSAGLVVRSNWIEDGNRQLDLVDAEDSAVLVDHPDYASTFVYGNVLIESDGEGNSQIVHYGGDSGSTGDYRKGTLFFHHNTVISTRSGNTTLLRLSTDDEHADVRNNVIYTTAEGWRLALLSESGVLDLRTNWLMAGWVTSHSSGSASVIDHGNNLVGSDPGFSQAGSQDFEPRVDSALVDKGGVLDPLVQQNHPLLTQYMAHQRASSRPSTVPPDIGAFEGGLIFADGLDAGTITWWSSATR